MRKYLLGPLIVLSLVLPVLTAGPATANSYPGLVEKEWSHGDDVLNARIAIEVNSAGEGRFRFRLRCFYVDQAGRHAQFCNFYPGTAVWCDLTVAGTPCPSRALGNIHDYDYTWVGSYRTLQNNHTYGAYIGEFRAQFDRSGYLGAAHNICTKKVTWHTGGSPTESSWC